MLPRESIISKLVPDDGYVMPDACNVILSDADCPILIVPEKLTIPGAKVLEPFVVINLIGPKSVVIATAQRLAINVVENNNDKANFFI